MCQVSSVYMRVVYLWLGRVAVLNQRHIVGDPSVTPSSRAKSAGLVMPVRSRKSLRLERDRA